MFVCWRMLKKYRGRACNQRDGYQRRKPCSAVMAPNLLVSVRKGNITLMNCKDRADCMKEG